MSGLFNKKKFEVAPAAEVKVPTSFAKRDAVNEARIRPLIDAAQNVSPESVKEALRAEQQGRYKSIFLAVSEPGFAGAKRRHNLEVAFNGPAAAAARSTQN